MFIPHDTRARLGMLNRHMAKTRRASKTAEETPSAPASAANDDPEVVAPREDAPQPNPARKATGR
ncbi:MAG: hypothetical protein RIC55_22340 [Pirellulaceae bacterium]